MQKLARSTKRKKLARLTKRILWIGVGSILVAEVIALLISQPAWTGFGPDSAKNTERDSTGKVIKTVEVEQSGKTLWDWLSVLGVPLSLAFLGFWFQQREQKRVDAQAKLERQRAGQQAKLEKEIAAANQREEALQVYFDRLSTLLIDKNLIAVAARVNAGKTKENEQNTAIDEDKELLNAAVDVIRARTLSILRQFGEDGERKSSVIQFLLETEVINKLNLNLSDANLSGADLSGANFYDVKFSKADLGLTKLSFTKLNGANLNFANLNSAVLIGTELIGATLSGAKFKDTDLSTANLSTANLSGADLSGANLNFANLSSANLSDANLSGADLSGAKFNGTNLLRTNLRGADLRDAKGLETKQLNQAKLCKTKLPEGCKLDPNRDCEELGLFNKADGS